MHNNYINISKMDRMKAQAALYYTMFLSIIFGFMSNPKSVFADTDVKTNIPKIDSNGTVSFGGDVKDVNSATTSFLEKSGFWIGVVTAVCGLILLVSGIMKGMKSAKEIQDGSPQGWKNVGNVIIGTIVGGALFVLVGLLIAVGAAFGLEIVNGK